MPEHLDLANLKHPEYSARENDWLKWRLTYDAGDEFIKEYMRKFSNREGNTEFQDRKDISYIPAFATAGVDEVKDAIFQRISDVTRDGGNLSYTDAVKGLNGGVDLAGTSMNSFIGQTILTELLPMERVGVFVDMPKFSGISVTEQGDNHPYIYHYRTENILNWVMNPKENTFTHLLLRDAVNVPDEETGLLLGFEIQFRLIRLTNEGVLVQIFDKDSELLDEKLLNLPEIPFVLFELPHSLLKITADYQIALMNLASSDVSYILKAGFPFYVEQFDPRLDNIYARPAGKEKDDTVSIVQPGERKDTIAAKPYEIEIGAATGRRIPKGLEMPMFISPPTDALLASMQKQDELKKDIRILIKLNVSNLTPKMASGESKSFDERSLEAGLSAIGLELERGERRVAKYWQMYEDRLGTLPTVKYPEKYSLQSDVDKRKEAKDLQESTKGHPSITYKKEVYKISAASLIGSNVSRKTLDTINDEINKAEVIVSDAEELSKDIEMSLIDPETASKAKGYPKGVVEKAEVAHGKRVARIAESQAKARGADDLGGLAPASRAEKLEKDPEEVPKNKTRS